MGSILRQCIDITDSPVVWVIEHDALVLPGRRDAVTATLMAHDDVAGVDCMTCGPAGNLTYPCIYRISHPRHPADENLIVCKGQTSLNCGAWKRKAWDCVDWAKVPEFPATDRVVSQHMMAAGWKLCIALKQTCIHLVGRARKHLPREFWRG